jgi:stage V sporulation protein B
LTTGDAEGTRTAEMTAIAEETPPASHVTTLDGAARRAGRGILSMSGSKLYFVVAGYAVQLLMPRLLGSPEAFGFFATAMSLVSILNNVLISATIQVVSKRISEDATRAPQTLRQALVVQLAIGLGFASLLFAGADPLASRVMLDPLLAPMFRWSALVVVSYALYAALIGALNGRQNFLGQAKFDVTYTTLRSGGMLGAAALGLGAVGAFGGFALAAVLVLLAALVVVGLGKAGAAASDGEQPWKKWAALMAPLWLYQLCLNIVLQIDTSLLKRTVAELTLTTGVAAADAADVASRYVGFYRAAQTFAFVPYQLILSVAFVIFPMVSEATSLGREDQARSYIQGALRFSLLVLLAIAAPIAGASDSVLRLVYPSSYLAGGSALAVLSIGMVCFALFVIGSTIMSGAGRPGVAAAIASVAVVIVLIGNVALVRWAGVGEHTLVAAASGTTLGTVLALVAIGIAVYSRFGAFIAPLTAARCLIAAACGFGVARALVGESKLSALIALVGGGLCYVVVLIATRELGRQELAAVERVVKRRKG